MVEAPRIRILYEKIRFTKGKKIITATGPSYNKAVEQFNLDITDYIIRKWWYAGKYIYVYLIKENHPSYVVRTHMMMFGKIVINDNIIVNPKLITFMMWELNDGTILKWYFSQIIFLDPDCKTDVIHSNYTVNCDSAQIIKNSFKMSKFDISHRNFNMTLMIKHIDANWLDLKDDILVDLLLNQGIFPGVGNILQQEALYRCKILPTKTVSEARSDIICLIDELKKVIYSLYKENKNKTQSLARTPTLQIYKKKLCPLGHKTNTKYLGYHNRRTTWCPICQN
jgi:formamidopyrimidine-DNA glycosylase